MTRRSLRKQPIYYSVLFLLVVLTCAWVLSIIYMANTIFQSIFSVIFLLIVPGFFAYRTLVSKIPQQEIIKTISYSVGLSLLIAIICGLGVNEVGIALGVDRPLTASNLSLTIGTLSLLLIAVSWWRWPIKLPSFKRTPIKKRVSKLHIWTVLFLIVLPVLAIGGANTLNNGGSNWLALLVVLFVSVAILLFAWQKKRFNTYMPYALYSVSLSILLATSMRGWNITGHDIIQEYQVFQLTLQHAAWHMSYYQDAYMACLSITILPTVFKMLTGIGDPYIFKFVFQLFSALLAPVLYLTLKPYVSRKIAYLAAIVFITFPTFISDLTMLNRQEAAILFFLLSVLAALDKKIGPMTKNILTFTFLIGMVLSHYSTSYVVIGSLLLCMVIALLLNRWNALRKKNTFKNVFSMFNPFVIIATLVCLFIWTGVITHTSSNISSTIAGITKSIPNILNGHVSANNSSKVGGIKLGILNEYTKDITTKRPLPASDYYSTGLVGENDLKEQPAVLDTGNSTLVTSVIPAASLAHFYPLFRSSYAGALFGLIVIGLFLILIKKVKTRLPHQYYILGFACLIIIGLQLVLPSNVIDYGLLRVLLQCLTFLSVLLVLAFYWVLSLLRIKQSHIPKIISSVLVISFLILTGFVSAIIGGDKPALALNNKGFYYQAYYTHQEDISAATWLKDYTPVGSRVYSDEFARRKLIAYSNIFSTPTLIPNALPADSYAFISTGDTLAQQVPVYYQGNLTFYSIPYEFLNNNKNLVYSNGSVTIFK